MKIMNYEWPRYEVRMSGQDPGLFDTWCKRFVMRYFSTNKREAKRYVRNTQRRDERHARQRIARLRRALRAAGGVTIKEADRLARHLDVDGVGRFDWWFR